MLRRLSMATLTMLLAGFARLAGAQAITGTIDGRVTDSSGGVLPGVTITVTNTATTATATVATTRDGLYRVPYLPPGPYDVRAVTPGSPSAARRSTISVAALSVNVTTSTWSAGTTSVAIAYAVRRLITRVLPVPAPA